MSQNLSSAAVVIGALRVKEPGANGLKMCTLENLLALTKGSHTVVSVSKRSVLSTW